MGVGLRCSWGFCGGLGFFDDLAQAYKKRAEGASASHLTSISSLPCRGLGFRVSGSGEDPTH